MSRKKYNYIETENDEIVSDDILETEIEDTENDISEVDVSNNTEEIVVKDNSDSVNIKFVGTIGRPDFKYEVV